MKIRFILGITLLIIVSSCTIKNNKPPKLSTELTITEEIMYDNPDSALHILQNMPKPQESKKLEHATWALFMTQAKYKLYIAQSDSLLNIAYDYFINKNDAQRKALVLYYRAALLHEESKLEEAQALYLKAIDEIEETNDHRLAYLIYAGIGDIYAYRLSDYAFTYYNKAQESAYKSNDKKQIIASYISIARVYGKKKEYEKAIEYYNKSIELADKNNEKLMQIGALSELAIVHKNIKNYRKALNILYQVISMEKENPKQLREQKYLTMAQIYRRINQPDSAIYLLQKALSSPNPLTKRGSFTTLFYLYKEKEMYQEAANYLEKGWILNDSIQKTERDKALIEMQEKYNQQKLINLKNNLELEKNRIIQLIYVCLIITAIIIGYLIYLHQKKMLQKERLIQEAKEEIATKSILIKENENTISRNETRIIALTREIEKNKEQQEFIIEQENALLEIKQLNLNLKTENNILQQEVNNASIILKRNSKEIKQLELLSKENQHLHEREYFLTSLLIRKNETFNKVIIKHQYIEEHQWIEIIREINYLFDNYTDRLIKLVPTLTESDIQICCLIKLHIKNSTIASLLAISPTSVTKRKVRLKERLIQTIGTFGNSQTLELWLREF